MFGSGLSEIFIKSVIWATERSKVKQVVADIKHNKRTRRTSIPPWDRLREMANEAVFAQLESQPALKHHESRKSPVENLIRKPPMERKLIRTIVAIFFWLPALCAADLYYWIDDNGIKHYSNVNMEGDSGATIRPETSSTIPAFDHRHEVVSPPEVAFKPTTATTTPKVRIELVHYDVEADNIEALRQKIFKVSPIRHDGQAFLGYTESHYNYSTVVNKHDELWYIDSVSLSVDIVITMPRWIDHPRARWKDQKQWDRFYAALMAHENKHKDIIVAAAKKLMAQLAAIEGTREQADLNQKAENIRRRIFHECDMLSKQFDEKTDHGRKEGIVL